VPVLDVNCEYSELLELPHTRLSDAENSFSMELEKLIGICVSLFLHITTQNSQ